jgi:hypothetical protein
MKTATAYREAGVHFDMIQKEEESDMAVTVGL